MANTIVGTWKLQDGDYPLTRVFLADGNFINRMGKLTQQVPYRVEGDEVVFLVEQPDKTILEQRERFTLSGNTLTFHDSDDDQRVFIRQPD